MAPVTGRNGNRLIDRKDLRLGCVCLVVAVLLLGLLGSCFGGDGSGGAHGGGAGEPTGAAPVRAGESGHGGHLDRDGAGRDRRPPPPVRAGHRVEGARWPATP
ncbi:hypothetical protein [Streptomyces megasporus]|uniref:hypothetical protein n=1 Tax=Streptomyces megasporus TaxID=44060 RepID=UPI0004E222F2|nr:hypothetical protein [Streptomyces megasporus]